MKPFAESSEQNKEVILEVLKPLCEKAAQVLEIGSGTGQHAVFFAEQMPHLTWHTSELKENHAGINMWLDEKSLPNTKAPIEIDVRQSSWAINEIDVIFSANTMHIMHWETVQAFIRNAAPILKPTGFLIVYGPFNYQNQYTSESNANFDIWLKNRDPLSAIRNFEDVDQLANENSLRLHKDYSMPANNRILCWQKI